MQITIVGAGKAGFAVASQLTREGHEISMIEKNEAVLNEVLAALDISGVAGNGISRELLEEAKAGEAELFIALTGNDEQNLLSCLMARKLGAQNTIARVCGPEYTSMLPLIADDLGLSMVVNPEKEAAMEIVRLLEMPSAKKIETFVQGKVEMIDYDVTADSPMCGKQVKDAFANMRTGLVAAVERDGKVFIPLGGFRFKEGDVMTVVAPAGKMYTFFQEAGVPQKVIKRVIISGGGRTSYYLAQQLLKQHIRVTVIEQNEAKAIALAEKLPQADIIVADGTSHSVLDEQGVDEADAFCCLTGIDEENILTSLYAKHIRRTIKTVTKINRVELTPIVRPLGLGSVVSPKLITADQVVSYVRAKQNGVGSGVLTLYHILEDKAEAIEFEVSERSKLVNVLIKDLKLKKDVILACINRKGQILSPRGNDALQPGDTVIIVTTQTGFDVLDDILRDE